MGAGRTSKVWKASSEAAAGLQVSEEYAALVGNKAHFVLADDRGVTLYGPSSIVADAANRRVGGLFTGINDLLHMFPSTIVSPIPQQMPNPLLHSIVELAQDTAYFMAFLV